jgi:hypothetical protein
MFFFIFYVESNFFLLLSAFGINYNVCLFSVSLDTKIYLKDKGKAIPVRGREGP